MKTCINKSGFVIRNKEYVDDESGFLSNIWHQEMYQYIAKPDVIYEMRLKEAPIYMWLGRIVKGQMIDIAIFDSITNADAAMKIIEVHFKVKKENMQICVAKEVNSVDIMEVH